LPYHSCNSRAEHGDKTPPPVAQTTRSGVAPTTFGMCSKVSISRINGRSQTYNQAPAETSLPREGGGTPILLYLLDFLILLP
jgi:hypothetical protein